MKKQKKCKKCVKCKKKINNDTNSLYQCAIHKNCKKHTWDKNKICKKCNIHISDKTSMCIYKKNTTMCIIL